MRKYFKVSLLSVFLFSLSFVFMGSNEVQAATIGQQLLQSEEKSNVILTLHLLNNEAKEYEITKSEFEKFLDWFDKRMNGEGKDYYVFENEIDDKPYQIIYNQIVWFEVKE